MLDFLIDYGTHGSLLLLVFGLVILISGGETLIRGASRLAISLGIPPLIVGLTVVAYCTSAPELTVSVSSSLNECGSIAVGNAVGSCICNICLILGLCALLAPIRVSAVLIRREIPLMIAVSCLLLLLAFLGGEDSLDELVAGRATGMLSQSAGALLVTALIAYSTWAVFEIRSNNQSDEIIAAELEEQVLGNIQQEVKGGRTALIVIDICRIIIGIGLLLLGSDMLIKGGTEIARQMGISELVIGLTVLAVGTSLPELAVSVLATFRGKTEIAVGNVVGSNIFNVLGVLGITSLVTSGGLEIPTQAMRFDIPVMIITSIFCIVFCFTGRRLNRGEGAFLLLCYALYLTFICLTDSAMV